MFFNIFLGIGGFHMEKIVTVCCGTYLANTGIENVLAEHEIYGPGVVEYVMSGSNYIRGKRDMVLLAETLQRLQPDAFVSLSHDALKDAKVKENMIALQNLCQNHNSNTSFSWEQYQGPMEEFLQAFNEFVKHGCLRSKSFHLWNTFLDDILLILIDLTRSQREEDWNLPSSAVRRALFTFLCL